ncbi:MAG TPA: AI-2E family transporter [Candidatus Hungatella pullicola]|nr:AI-2E family transporter [Candidatus Hungatella pullicola]
MEKPSKKLKKTLLILGVTGAVYLSFRYLLPLVIPFLFAYLAALALRPSALWIQRKLSVSWRGRPFQIPLAVAAGGEIILICVIAGFLFYWGGRKIYGEICLLADNLPNMIDRLDHFLTSHCHWAEEVLHLPEGFLVAVLQDMLRQGKKTVQTGAMPFLVANSVHIIRCCVQCLILTVIFFLATVLCLQEMDDLRRRRDNSIFRREFALLGNRLMSVGKAWLKTQGSIMALTAAICTAGFFLMGNPYSIILGVLIGLLDALPIFGTGTVLIPWAVFSAMSGRWATAAGLAAIYVVCYLLREVMEAKVMGDKVGLTPLETLAAMYAGLKLFGFWGFILGPLGLLIIEDLVEMYGSG